jgi:hypothetical protein
MRPAPQLRIPQGAQTVLISGRKLNEIMTALKARTPLNTASAGAQGVRGVAATGAAGVAALDGRRYDPARNYFLTAAFLESVSTAPSPPDSPPRPPPVTRAASAPGRAAHSRRCHASPPARRVPSATAKALALITPRQPAESGPGGWTQEVPSRTARLALEIETKVSRALICAEARPAEEDYILEAVDTNVFENGSVVATTTHSGVVQLFETEADLEDCAVPDFTTTFDPGFDYGGFVDSSYEVDTSSFADLRAAAIAGLTGIAAVAAEQAYEWPEAEWRETSLAPGLISGVGLLSIGATTADAYYPQPWSAAAHWARWRMHNRGQCVARVNYEVRKVVSGDLVSSGVLNLARNAVSDWWTPPALDTSPAERIAVTFPRVRLGPHLGLA